MATTRRRARPIRKPSKTPQRKRRPRKVKIDWGNSLIQFLIVMVLVVDLILVFFVIRQCSKPVAIVKEEKPPPEVKILQVEVLNGCGVSGVANKFTDHLRANGFDVVKTDNYESFNVLRTVVIDRRGNLENAISVAKAMGLGEERVLQEVHEAYLIDATVILGKDFRQLAVWRLMEN
jgi:hypothetical protein